MDLEAFIHFIGGAVGGTAGTALTCPLEVVKTRLQSSSYSSSIRGPSTSEPTKGIKYSKSVTELCRQNFGRFDKSVIAHPRSTFGRFLPLPSLVAHGVHSSSSQQNSIIRRPNILRIFHRIIVDEGFSALYKGLGPNLVGVAPSKAVYFYSYSSCKRLLNDTNVFVPNSAIIHMISAASAGFLAATAVNPVWLVKTRLQLHKGPLSITECIKRVYRKEGIKGFYRGVTASYVGISETVIQFVLYEELRSYLLDTSNQGNENNGDVRKKDDFVKFMFAGGIAKFIACVAAYPHEVVRTRLREENSQTRGFFSTLKNIYRLEGSRALYRGLGVQLMRTVPNTAITMGAYELVVYLLQKVLS